MSELKLRPPKGLGAERGDGLKPRPYKAKKGTMNRVPTKKKQVPHVEGAVGMTDFLAGGDVE
jgi:hypothetical protein